MTCPESVRILGVDVPVVRSDSDQEWGSYSCNTGRIFLAERGGTDIQACTLLHEICHVLEVELAIKLGEKTITRLSAGLFQMLRDNPRVVNFLMGETYEVFERIPMDFDEYCWRRLSVSVGRRKDGGHPDVAPSEPTDGSGGPDVPKSGKRVRNGETPCTE